MPGDDAAHVAAADEDADRRITRAPTRGDVHAAAAAPRGRRRRDSGMRSPSGVSTRIVAHGVRVGAAPPREPNDHAESPLALPDLRRVLAAERGLDRRPGCRRRSGRSARRAARSISICSCGTSPARSMKARATPRHCRHARRAPSVASLRSVAVSSPKTLITIWPSICEMLSSTLSRIGCEKLGSMPGHRLERASHLGRCSSSLVMFRVHSDRRLQVDEELRHVDQLGIGAVLGPARLRDHRCALRELPQQRADARAARATPRVTEMPGGSVRFTQIEPSFSSGRNSLPSCGATPSAQRASAATRRRRSRAAAARAPRAAPAGRRACSVRTSAVLLVRHASPQQEEAQQRHQRQREQQRPDQRRRDRCTPSARRSGPPAAAA